jgi:phosphoribosylamine--glycine ligase
VFHAGTAQIGDDVVTNGGRVLCACALGNSIQEAQTNAYQLAKAIQWNGIYYRTDIGFKAIRN